MNEMNPDIPPDSVRSAICALNKTSRVLQDLRIALEHASQRSRAVVAEYKAMQDLSEFVDTGEITIDEAEPGMAQVIRLPSNPG